MQALTLPASRGWRWFSEGFMLFHKKQLILSLFVLSYWFSMALIDRLPVIGQVVAMLLIPVFSVSLMNTCRLIAQGNRPAPLSLFSGFRKNLRGLLALGVSYMVASFIILGISAAVDNGILFRLIVLGIQPSEEALASGELMVAGQLALVLFSPLMMAYWYAPVLVAWHDLSAGKSLFFSFIACARNWRAFLVYVVTVLIFGTLVPVLLASLLSSFFAKDGDMFSVILTSLIVLVLLPTLYASFYVSYRDVFVTINDDA